MRTYLHGCFGWTALLAAMLAFSTHAARANDELTKVDCADGESIQEELDEADIGETIQVNGTCVENITIRTDRVSLIAGPDGGGITSADPGQNVLTIRANDVSVTGLQITGGASGILVIRSGSANLSGNIVTSFTTTGIVVTQSSYGRLVDNTVTGTGIGTGIVVVLSSSADIFRNQVTNALTGLFMSRNGSADIVGNTFSNNAGNGVGLFRGAVAEFSADLFEGNAPNTIENNGLRGILCTSNGVVRFGAPQQFGSGNGLADFSGFGCSVTGSPA